MVFTQRHSHVDYNERTRGDEEKCLAIPPTDPVKDKESRDFGRNFNSTINELCEVDVDAKAWDFEADPIVKEGNCKPANSASYSESTHQKITSKDGLVPEGSRAQGDLSQLGAFD